MQSSSRYRCCSRSGCGRSSEALATQLRCSSMARIRSSCKLIAATVMAIANIGLSIWLTARIGVAGVVWGTAISYGFLVLVPMAAYVPRVLQRIGARASVPRR